ncbi:TorF family putative porin [Variovorax sp. J22P168]|uniref:TorF family putative porin n=1 Tax=Variovorax jilinensis TaxID=3053513 RepID=UPI0025771495|nr:TorF family putative porin [Variovorax sp. J22P168]MDM0015923.1 TorF family putative porin [Variovorax sp. J22P168]
MYRKSVQILALGTLAALPMLASAQAAAADPAPAPNLTGNVAITTNYKFRGQDQDMIGKNDYAKDSYVKPAIQGGIDYAFGSSGFYVGNWNSSVNWLPGNSVEMDFYGGYKFKGGPIDWDVGVLTYVYPGNTAGNTTEIYGAGTWADEAIGAFTAKYSWTVSKDYFNYAGNKGGSGLDGTNTGYLNFAYTKEIIPKVIFKAAVGYTFFSSDIKSLGYKDYLDYNVGAAYDFGSGLTLGGYIQGGNEQSAFNVLSNPGVDINGTTFGATTFSPNKTRFILTLTKTL